MTCLKTLGSPTRFGTGRGGSPGRAGRAARAAGTDARVDVVHGGIHGVQGLINLEVPEAVAAWASVARFTDGLLGS